MDFQLKTLSLSQAAGEKVDTLIVLTGEAPPKNSDALSRLLAGARKSDDLPHKAGKLLALYRAAGTAATHLLLRLDRRRAAAFGAQRGACRSGRRGWR